MKMLHTVMLIFDQNPRTPFESFGTSQWSNREVKMLHLQQNNFWSYASRQSPEEHRSSGTGDRRRSEHQTDDGTAGGESLL